LGFFGVLVFFVCARTVSIQHFDAQELHVMVRVWLVVPQVIPRIAPPVPLAPRMKARHSFSHLG